MQGKSKRNWFGPLDESIEMKPMLPAALPYALERDQVDGIVMDIIGALQMGVIISLCLPDILPLF